MRIFIWKIVEKFQILCTTSTQFGHKHDLNFDTRLVGVSHGCLFRLLFNYIPCNFEAA